MRKSWSTADGHTYERIAIEQWLATSATSPKTNELLPHTHLVPNHALRSMILDWHTNQQHNAPSFNSSEPASIVAMNTLHPTVEAVLPLLQPIAVAAAVCPPAVLGDDEADDYARPKAALHFERQFPYLLSIGGYFTGDPSLSTFVLEEYPQKSLKAYWLELVQLETSKGRKPDLNKVAAFLARYSSSDVSNLHNRLTRLRITSKRVYECYRKHKSLGKLRRHLEGEQPVPLSDSQRQLRKEQKRYAERGKRSREHAHLEEDRVKKLLHTMQAVVAEQCVQVTKSTLQSITVQVARIQTDARWEVCKTRGVEGKVRLRKVCNGQCA